MNAPARSLLDQFAAIVGAPYALRDPAAIAPYLIEPRDKFGGRTPLVLRPGSVAEVSAILNLANETRTPIVPQGGNTGVVGGQIPSPAGNEIVVSLSRINKVRTVDATNNTMTVDAGVTLAEAQAAAEAVDRLFPLSLASEGSCQIGGNISTNAGGTAVLAYGNTRELVLGIEAVLPSGEIWNGLRTLRKDNTGYDLKQLFIGAEGTLGVVTAAVLRLLPDVPRRATALLALPDVGCAVAMLPLLRTHTGGLLTAWELINREALGLVLTHLPGARDPFGTPHAWYGLVELAGGSEDVEGLLESALEAAVERELVVDAVVAGSRTQRAALWALREGISEAQRIGGASIKHDVTLPIAELAEFVAEIGDLLDEVLPGVRRVTYGHVGDGNLHYNLSAPPSGDAALRASAPDLTRRVYDAVAGRGGSISAEHGLGSLKREAAASYKSDVEIDLMRSVKQALDPRGLMNPGKVVP
jgi:FAD/FMN-containing dehydrogenase